VDLLAVLVGAIVGAGVLTTWVMDSGWLAKISVTVVGVLLISICYLFPAYKYLQRAVPSREERQHTLGRMILAACLSGVPLLATWGGVMWVYNWLGVLTKDPDAKPWTQISSAFGAAVGCVLAALLGERIGRKRAYMLMCVASAITLFCFYRFNTEYGLVFVLTAGIVGMITASFYGWLPLYLPELFPTAVRATGQGFGFNFGRVMASIGSLQTTALLSAFDNQYSVACSAAAGVYVFGLLLILLAPETKGKPLPE
jgi:MFS family permease